MVSLKKELVFFVILFWALCFFVGYRYGETIKYYLFNPTPEVQGESKVQGTQQTVNNIANEQLQPYIQQIEPTQLDTLLIETYYVSEEVNSFAIQSNIKELSTCSIYDKKVITEIDNPNDLLALVNKQHKVNERYVPNDLILLTDILNIPTLGKIYLRKEAAQSFKEMYLAMYGAGYKVTASSGWRSLTFQQKVLTNWTRNVGSKNANMYAALPGFSEHHLGTAIDVLTPENGYTIAQNYFNTKTFKWLSENSYKYGYLLSYPQGKTDLTGYNPEGWHYRYVGKEAAKEVHDQNITLSEYLYNLNGICY
jgi:D-alanyl-D-alanine carboxypeptidase